MANNNYINNNPYQKALEAAGAVVIVFKEFGTYQGDWWAKVTYRGKHGWVQGSYGSCHACDAFQSEFGYAFHEVNRNKAPIYDIVYHDPFDDDEGFRDDCEICRELKERFIKFGAKYLEDILTQEQAEVEAAKNITWDSDASPMLEFIKKNGQ